jgi:hypothetical protein
MLIKTLILIKKIYQNDFFMGLMTISKTFQRLVYFFLCLKQPPYMILVRDNYLIKYEYKVILKSYLFISNFLFEMIFLIVNYYLITLLRISKTVDDVI